MQVRLGQTLSWCAAVVLVLAGWGVRADAQINFQPPVHYPVTSADYGVAVDLDGDGKMDIVGSDWTIGVFVLYGKGDGTFEQAVYYPVATHVYQVTAVDLNKDGRLDLVTGSSDKSTVGVLLSTGPRTFAPAVFYTSGLAPYGVSVGDLNEDGYPDLISADAGDNTISILINKGNGTFNSRTTLPCAGEPNQVVIADLNHDGHLDAAVSAYDTGVHIYYGNGTGALTVGPVYACGARCFAVLGEDFNKDGWLDLAVSNYASGTVSILLNDKTGKFVVQPETAAGSYPHLLRVADLDLDGEPDLVVPNSMTPTFAVLHNSYHGQMSPPTTFQTGGSISRAVAVGDFNGDGLPDVAISDVTGAAVHVFINASQPATPGIVSVVVSPPSVNGGSDAKATVKLSQPAPAGGWHIGLSSNNPIVTIDPGGDFAAGETTTTFALHTQIVSQDTPVILQASFPTSGSATTDFLVAAATVSSVSINPSSLYGGNSTTGKVTLGKPAPPGGYAVTLSSDNPAASVPASVTVPEGATFATFPITTVGVGTKTTAVIKGQLGPSFRAASVYVYPSIPSTITYNPSQVRGGKQVTATLTLTGKAPPGGLAVNVVSLNPNVLTPDAQWVAVPEGQTSTTFNVTTYPVQSLTLGVLKATAAGASIQIGLRVYPAGPQIIRFSNSAVYGGNPMAATLLLSSPAPAGGLYVALQSQDPTLAEVPSGVTIPAGESAIGFLVQTHGVSTKRMAVISASANNESIYFGLQLYPAVPLHIRFTPNPVKAGSSVSATLFLNGAAPPGGLTVALAAETPNAATGPASLFLPEGTSSITFPVATQSVSQNTLAVFAATANGTTIHIGFTVVP